MKKNLIVVFTTVFVLGVLNVFQDNHREKVIKNKVIQFYYDQAIKTDSLYQNCIDSLTINRDSLLIINDSLRRVISKLESNTITVTATMYHPVLGQCDATPDITADQTKIPNVDSCSHLNWIAVSQDLLWFNGGPFRYGDRVVVSNAGHKDGVYTIRDAMNKRFTYKIDFLESVNTRGYRYDDVVMAKL